MLSQPYKSDHVITGNIFHKQVHILSYLWFGSKFCFFKKRNSFKLLFFHWKIVDKGFHLTMKPFKWLRKTENSSLGGIIPLSTIVWMNSTLSHYLNTTCGSKLHLVVTIHLHWLELYFQLPIKTPEKQSNLETNDCVRKHREHLQMGSWVMPYLFVATVFKSASFPEN